MNKNETYALIGIMAILSGVLGAHLMGYNLFSIVSPTYVSAEFRPPTISSSSSGPITEYMDISADMSLKPPEFYLELTGSGNFNLYVYNYKQNSWHFVSSYSGTFNSALVEAISDTCTYAKYDGSTWHAKLKFYSYGGSINVNKIVLYRLGTFSPVTCWASQPPSNVCQPDQVNIYCNGNYRVAKRCKYDGSGWITSTLYCQYGCSNGQCKSAPVCGNGVKEAGEQCDGKDGVPSGYYCDSSCHLQPVQQQQAVCGDGKIEQGEVCDGDTNNYICINCQQTDTIECQTNADCGNYTATCPDGTPVQIPNECIPDSNGAGKCHQPSKDIINQYLASCTQPVTGNYSNQTTTTPPTTGGMGATPLGTYEYISIALVGLGLLGLYIYREYY